MKTKPHPIAPKSTCLCIGLLGASTLLWGCAGSKVNGPRTQDPQQVTIDDFVAPQDNFPPHASTTPEQQSTSPYEENPQTEDELTLRPPPIPNLQPPPRHTPATALPHAVPLALLDAKVGDVNGKPIFTNSFFAPIQDRLITEASQLSPTNWRRFATKQIESRLDGLIADELLRAEALTSLTPTQRVGLQAFLNNFRDDMLSKNLGSSQLASQRLKENQGQTLDEALEQKELDTLVQLTLIQEVNRRVNVSWRDIKQRYERDIDQYAPPPSAVLRVIRVFKDETEKVSTITSMLDNGTDFVEIAANKLNNYKTESDGMHTVPIVDSYENTKFFGPDILNEHTAKLSVGEFVGPIELGSSIYWIKLMEIKQETISLYDAQLKIHQELTLERRIEARNQYLGKLMERAKVSSRDEVLARLLEIAELRYGPEG